MTSAIRTLCWIALASFCFVAALGCTKSATPTEAKKDEGGGKTKANFEKVKEGMSEDEVEKLLGKTDKVQKGSEMPVPMPGNVVGKTWEEGDKMYIVVFKDGKVATTKVDDKPK